ncbi:hypothetical protein KAU11_05650 [Candidatus Babeliales bacterium]|nr:hypothetical protein [Candidatus Babeliales bacterium]
MNIQNIKSGWHYAFSFFKWTELKLIIFASLLTAKRSFKHVLIHSGLAILAATALLMFCSFFMPTQQICQQNACFTIPLCIKIALMPFILLMLIAIYAIPVLAVRTSHARKDFSYFWSYRTTGLLFFSLILFFPALLIGFFLKPLTMFPITYSLFGKPITTAFWISITMFFLDALSTETIWQATKNGIVNGLKMMAYFTPIFLFPWQFFVSAPFLFLEKWISTNKTQIITWLQRPSLMLMPIFTRIAISFGALFGVFIIIIFFVTLMYSFYAVLYLKLKHNRHDVFFGQNKALNKDETN